MTQKVTSVYFATYRQKTVKLGERTVVWFVVRSQGYKEMDGWIIEDR